METPHSTLKAILSAHWVNGNDLINAESNKPQESRSYRFNVIRYQLGWWRGPRPEIPGLTLPPGETINKDAAEAHLEGPDNVANNIRPWDLTVVLYQGTLYLANEYWKHPFWEGHLDNPTSITDFAQTVITHFNTPRKIS